MFQPEVKLEFVHRYCPPHAGWKVFVDIDASEEGRTGGERKTPEATRRQRQMKRDCQRVRMVLASMGVTVGGNRALWFRENGIQPIDGDRDVVAINHTRSACVIAEIEGESSGQPEQKLYKAIGQIVMAASGAPQAGWQRALLLVVYGQEIAKHLHRASALAKLGISALAMGDDHTADQWLFHDALLPKLLSSDVRVPKSKGELNYG